jgi:hypothetical protein
MNGERLRVLSLAFTPSVEEEEGDRAITPARIRKRCVLLVGADRVPLDHSLGVMAGALGVMTATTSVASFARGHPRLLDHQDCSDDSGRNRW